MKEWKRYIAAALSFITFLTSVNITDAAGIYDKKYSVWTANAAEVVAEQYNLSDEELDVLYSSAINAGYLYRVFGPYENTKGSKKNLLEVDYVNKVVYAKTYTKSGYIWTPARANIIANGEVVESLNLDEGVFYYNDREYNASQAFTYDGNKYTVELIFELFVTIGEKEQERILQIPVILGQTANNIAVQMSNAHYDLKALGEMTPVLMQLLDMQYEKKEIVTRTVNVEEPLSEVTESTVAEEETMDNVNQDSPVIIDFGTNETETVSETVVTLEPLLDPVDHADVIEAIKGLYNEYTANNGLILYNLSEKYRTGDGDVLKFADNYGTQIQKNSAQLFKYIDTLSASTRLGSAIKKLAETDVELYAQLQNFRSTVSKLSGKEKRPGPIRVLQNPENWKFLEPSVRANVLKASYTKEAYADLEYAAYALRDDKLDVPAIEGERLKAAEVSISWNISICDIHVSMEGEVASQSSAADYIAMQPADTTIVMLEGSTRNQIESAIDASGLEDLTLAEWNALDAEYDITPANYIRTVTELPDSLNKDLEYQISYAPRKYTVDTNFQGKEKLPYGYKIKFPVSTDEEISYDYVVETEDGARISFDEGAVYKVTKSVKLTQMEGTEKTEHRLYDFIVIDVQYADLFSADEKKILASPAIESPTLNIRVPNDETVPDVVLENGVYSITAKEYASGIYGMSWEPVAVYVMNGSQLREKIPLKDGVASWTDSYFTHVNVDYKLKIEKVKNSFLSNRELSEREDVLYALNLPYELTKVVVEENQYLSGTERVSVKSIYEKISGSSLFKLLDHATLNMLATEERYLKTEKAKKAAKLLATDVGDGGAWNSYAGEDGELALCTYARNCESAKWHLAPYYREGYYKVIPKQAGLIAECLEIIAADPGAQSLLASYSSSLNALIRDLKTLSGERPGPHKAMKIHDPYFAELINDILSMEGEPTKFDSSGGIYAYHTVEKNGENRGTISISVKVGSRLSKVERISYDLVNGSHTVDASEETQIHELIKELEASLRLTAEEKNYYDRIETAIPKAGDTVGKNAVVSLVYTPKEYTVEFSGMKEKYTASFKYNSDQVIKLPAYSKNPEELNYYCYIIGNVEMRVNNGSFEYFTFSKEDLTTLFNEEQHYQAQVIVKQTYSQWDVKPVVKEDGETIRDSYLDFENKLLYLEVNPWGISENAFRKNIQFENGFGEEKSFEIFNYNRAGHDFIATGAVVECYSEDEKGEAVVTEYTIVLMGDVNKDGQVTLADLKMLKDNYIGIAAGEDRILDDPTKLAADMNGNGKAFDSNDALLMSKKYNYWIPVDDVEYKSVLE